MTHAASFGCEVYQADLYNLPRWLPEGSLALCLSLETLAEFDQLATDKGAQPILGVDLVVALTGQVISETVASHFLPVLVLLLLIQDVFVIDADHCVQSLSGIVDSIPLSRKSLVGWCVWRPLQVTGCCQYVNAAELLLLRTYFTRWRSGCESDHEAGADS